MNDTQANGVNLPGTVRSKWDEMISAYNAIVAKINQISGSMTFRATSGKNVDGAELASRLESVLYKLYWACKSLEYIVEYHEKHAKSIDDSLRSMTEELPNTFPFNADVFFSFGYAALDLAAEVIHMMVETGIDEDHVYLTNVLDFLTKAESIYRDSLLCNLNTESKAGWLHQFRQYRVFVTHHGIVQPSSHFEYTASDHTVEINLYMLPDNPKKRPPTYEKKRELAPYCTETMVKELEAMAVLFGFIGKMIPTAELG